MLGVQVDLDPCSPSQEDAAQASDPKSSHPLGKAVVRVASGALHNAKALFRTANLPLMAWLGMWDAAPQLLEGAPSPIALGGLAHFCLWC